MRPAQWQWKGRWCEGWGGGRVLLNTTPAPPAAVVEEEHAREVGEGQLREAEQLHLAAQGVGVRLVARHQQHLP